MRRCGTLMLCLAMGLLAAGCPKRGQTDFEKGRKAETVSDYDAAVTFYQNALKADPQNANYRVKLDQSRFEAGNQHVRKGLEYRKEGDLQNAAQEFQRALAVDASSPVAEQELRKTMELIAEKNGTNQPTPEEAPAMELATA